MFMLAFEVLNKRDEKYNLAFVILFADSGLKQYYIEKKTVHIVGTMCYFVSIRLANYTVLQYNIISFFNVCKFTKINSWDGHLSSTQTFLQSNRILRTWQPDITNFGYSTKPEVANYLNIDDELRQTYICTWDFDP